MNKTQKHIRKQKYHTVLHRFTFLRIHCIQKSEGFVRGGEQKVTFSFSWKYSHCCTHESKNFFMMPVVRIPTGWKILDNIFLIIGHIFAMFRLPPPTHFLNNNNLNISAMRT